MIRIKKIKKLDYFSNRCPVCGVQDMLAFLRREHYLFSDCADQMIITKGGEMMSLKSWAKKEQSKLDEQRKMKFKNFKPAVGTTKVQILDEDIREISGQYGDATIFAVKVAGKKMDWLVNNRSPVKRRLVELLAQGIMVVNVIRVGKGLSTRYTIEAI